MATKRIAAMILAMGILLSNTLLVAADTTADNPSSTPPATVLIPGEVGLAVQKNSLGNNSYRIIWELDSSDTQPEESTSADVVLLINTSEAYASAGGLAQSIASAQELIDSMLVENSKNRVAIVAFHQTALQLHGLAGVEQKQALLASLPLSAQGQGNYLEAGIRAARQLLAGSTADEKRILLFSDGEASYSTKVKQALGYPYCTENCSAGSSKPFWEFDITYDSKATRLGSPAGLTTQLSFSNVVTPQLSTCSYGQAHKWTSNKYPATHGDTAIYESDLAVGAGVKITALSLGGNSLEGEAILARIANAGLYNTLGEEYAALLKQLSAGQTVPALSAGSLTLPLGEFFVVNEDSLRASEGTQLTYHKQEGRLVWELGVQSTGSLSLEVRLTVEQPGFVKEQEYALFPGAGFAYLNTTGEEATKEVPPLAAAGTFTELFFTGLWSDAEGNYLTEAGEQADNPAQAKVLARSPYDNEHGVNQWAAGRKITLATDQMSVPSGYLLHPDQQPFTLWVGDNRVQEEHYKLVENSLSYQIHYYYAGEDTPFDTTTMTNIAYGTTVHTIADSARLQAGYLRVEASQLPRTILDHSAILRVTYALNSSDLLPYTLGSVYTSYRRKSSPNSNAANVYSGKERSGIFSITRGNAPPTLENQKCIFNKMT